MRYLVLAADYDGTLAHDGRVDDATWEALRQLRESGRKLFMVTGRELDDLLTVCPQLDRFDAFLRHCECAVAVANAVPAVKERADLVTQGARGAGVVELVQRLLADDLAAVAPALRRHEILFGTAPDGTEQRLAPYGHNVLVAGTSGSGKSTFTTAFLEGLCEHHYQYVVIDPEGDYANMEEAVVLGLPERAPLLDEVLDVLRTSGQSAVVNLLGLPLDKRPAFFDR